MDLLSNQNERENTEYGAVRFHRRTPLVYAVPEYERRVEHRSEKALRSLGKDWKTLILPMIAYHVVIPIPTEHKLNLFQDTILKLLSLRNYSDAELAEKLCINIELAAIVAKQLTDKGLIENRQLTEKGEVLLKSETCEPEMRTGYVFYDISTGDFIEDFLPDTSFVTYDYSNTEKLFSFVATKNVSQDKKVFRREAFCIDTDVGEFAPPTLTREKGLQICRGAARRFWYSSQREKGLDIDDADDNTPAMDLTKFRIRVIAAPEAVYAAVCVFYTNSNTMEWSVTSPCSTHISQTLTNTVQRCSLDFKNKDLALFISNIDKDSGIAENRRDNSGERENTKKVAEQLKALYSAAKTALSDEILVSGAGAARAYNSLYSDTVSFVKDKYKYEDEMSEYILGCFGMIEHSLNDAKKASFERVSRMMSEDESGSRLRFSDMLSDRPSNNADRLTITALDRFGFVKGEKFEWKYLLYRIRGSLLDRDMGESNVEKLIAANLVLAEYDNEHPFRSVGKYPEQRKFLCFIAELKKYRDSFSHDFRLDFTFTETAGFMMDVLSYVGWLHGIDEPDTDAAAAILREASADDDEQIFDKDMMIKCRRELTRRQIDTSQSDGLVQQLIKCVYAMNVKPCRKRDFVKNTAVFFELFLKRFFYLDVDRDTLKEAVEEMAGKDSVKLIVSLCTELDCLPVVTEYIERFYVFANVARPGDEIRIEKSVCSKVLFYMLVNGARVPDTAFGRFIRGRSDFINDVCRIHCLRGHSGAGVSEYFGDDGLSEAEARLILDRLCEYTKFIRNEE